MFKKNFKISILFLVIISFSSCEDVVQIDLDKGSPLIVIDAFINNLREDQVIKITNNSDYFSTSNPTGLSGANVVLSDLTANKDYTFNYTTDGKYVFTLGVNDTIAKTNHNYKLTISINGATYIANTTQKRPCGIDSIGVILNDGSFGFGPPQDPNQPKKYLCVLFAKDKVDNETDFYWIKTYRNDTLFNSPGDLNVNVDGTGGEVEVASADSVEFTAPSTLLGFKDYYQNDICRVEVNSITRQTYNFFVQAQAQINNGGLFATTPENVRTNFSSPKDKTKAVGWFSISSVATKSVQIK
jgi:hypothetical protein